MDHRSQAIIAHPIHSQLEQLGRLLESLRTVLLASPEATEEWARINAIHQWIQQRVATSDPAVVYLPALDNINAHLTQAFNSLRGVTDPGNLSVLQTANDQAENALAEAFRLPGTAGRNYPRSLSQYLQDYADAVEAQKTRLEAKTQKVFERLQELQNRQNDIESRTNEQIEAWKEQVKAHEASFQAEESSRTARFEESERGQTSSFEEGEKGRENRLEKALAESAERFEELLQTRQAEVDDLVKDTKEKQAAMITELEASVGKAKELVSLTGRLTRANAYREAAKQENVRAWIWSSVAFLALAVLSVLAFRTLWVYTNAASHPSGFDWSGFSIRLYSLFALSGLAFYAGRQGEIHRNAERQNRRLFSDLASINPYLSDIDPAEREQILIQVAQRIFGQPEAQTEPMKHALALSPDQISKFMDLGLEAAGKALKKAP